MWFWKLLILWLIVATITDVLAIEKTREPVTKEWATVRLIRNCLLIWGVIVYGLK